MKLTSLPPPSCAPSPSMEGWWVLSPLEQAPKSAHHNPTTTMSVAPKEEEEVTSQKVLLLSGPSEAIAGPLGISMLPMVLQRGHLVPCCIHQLALPTRSFVSQLEGLQQNVHIQAVWKAYLQLGLIDVSLPWGTSGGLSSLSPVWDGLFRSFKVLSLWQGDLWADYCPCIWQNCCHSGSHGMALWLLILRPKILVCVPHTYGQSCWGTYLHSL